VHLVAIAVLRKAVHAAMMIVPVVVQVLVQPVKIEMALLMALAVPVFVVPHNRSFSIHILRYI